jgi:2-polyprenyl-6-methoxyphenol hydroxylase-like FAD-dependent oxidoreductase
MTDEQMSANERVPGPSGAKSLPPSVDRATFEAQVSELRVREKAHTHEGDAIAAARRRLPMVEMDATLPLIGAAGPVTLLDAFEGRRQLIAGLGTSLALVGAYVLAGELAAGRDHRLAFAGYERIMRPYVDASQKLPPGGMRAYAPQSQRAIWARWMSTRLMASRPLCGLTRRLFFSKAGAIDLPQYAPPGLNVP